jgi:hypothetical protein
MNPPPDLTPPGSDEHRHSVAITRGDRDRALEAMHALEAASGRAGRGRDEDWRQSVAAALDLMSAAIAEQQASYENPHSLMAQLAQDDPRLRTWVRQLHHRWSSLAAATSDLAGDLRAGGPAGSRSIDDVREQVRWLSAALHHHRAREADLIFEGLGLDIAAA